MSQFSPRRAVTAAGLALGTAALGVAFAPAAMAAPSVTVSQSTVAPGATYTVSGTECISQDSNYDALGVVFLAVGAQSADAEPAAVNGSWSITQTAPTEAGTYEFAAVCDWYTDGFDYQNFTLTVATPSTPAPAPAPTPASAPVAPGTPRGQAAITPGVTSPDTGAATGDRAPLGQKVVKVLTGFKPFEVVTVTLNSTPQRVGSFTADASGTVRIEFTVPAGTPVGDHTLVYEGDKGTYFQESFAVASATLATTGSSQLASTGASVALPLGLGLGALAAGGGLVFAARRRSAGAVQA
ncbi:LPXTG-motif cell wall anchor domain-containing protein [Blastococcus aggregatus]|uniref:LPXTG-motif cell wall anchor domain-containing protein n=1 Tax=Blastococcus aggregatus TaxID=38502 RepID=A0A285V2Y5_9ACTN|nr:LPXTG cell wall anchor domain-containing protein [Blastococcus aggregatus]SOC48515.1 LPXTG-motif cell wall anchor domain-containing protein [Blastococcus aggregatus]